MSIIRVKRIKKKAKLPIISYEGDAGMDLFAAERAALKPGENALIGTGISIAIPKGFVGLIWDRSGLAAKHSIHVLAGVIDSSYRGEIKVVLINLGKKAFRIEPGMRIAQLLVQPIINPRIEEVNELDSTERGNSGFGSTGLKSKLD